ncbi:MAG: RIP metalloprotease RseP [Candidatus Peregrinibacteria bacterium]|nr:RIP metalloprotease RseP [Candidatus Peregrinibacteria bacterium]
MISILISIIAFIIIFSALILVHEFGHFWMAKRAGVRVDEFGFGLPPRMFGKKKGDTLYSLNWIPFGGFVRLFGEDPNEFRADKSKQSFLTKTPWQKTTIVLGGVFMNFVLAWVLLTFGLFFGLEPLIVGYDQFADHIHQGDIEMSPYHVFEKESAVLKADPGDYILSINDKLVSQVIDVDAYVAGLDGDKVSVRVRHFSEPVGPIGYNMGGSIDHKYTVKKAELDGAFELFPVSNVPRAVVRKNIEPLLLEKGDVILRINKREVLGEADFLQFLYAGKIEGIDVFRSGAIRTVAPDISFGRTIVDKILPDSPAEKSGIIAGDVFVSIEGIEVFEPQAVKLVTETEAVNKPTLSYVFERNSEQINIDVTPDENGLIGVALSPMVSTQGIDVDFYESFLISSVLDIKAERYGLLKAPFKAFGEIKNVSLLTAKMMGNVFAGVLSSGEVPDSVSGPVGIAQMTYLSVQDGFMAVIRFAAILSLSLGVLNILPFPALDGGRFVFVIIESIIGRRINHKFEAMIHAIGFAVLLLLIVLITWNDIARLF